MNVIQTKLTLTLLCLFIVFALLHMLHNARTFFADESRMLFLSGAERDQIVYGELLMLSHVIFTTVPRTEPILLHSKDGKPYFYLRYFLYPRHIYWTGDTERELPKEFSYELFIGEGQTPRTGEALYTSDDTLLIRTK